jgi:DNA-directed RNA polymerase beta' subunit
MKSLLKNSFLVIILILFSTLSSYAGEACFSEKSTIKLESDLKECEFDSAECAKCYEDKDLADKQIELLKQKVELYKEAMALNEQTIKQYQELLKYQKESYNEVIKANKPSFIREIFNTFGFIGIGILIGLAL